MYNWGKKLDHPPTGIIPSKHKKSMIVNFMVCTKKKKMKLKKNDVKNFRDFCQKVQDMILNLAKDSQCNDVIIFDMYVSGPYYKSNYKKITKEINKTCSSA